MIKEQWWSLLKVLVQRYESGAAPAISAVLSVALPSGSILTRSITEMVRALSTQSGLEQEQVVQQALRALGPDQRFLNEVVMLLMARFDGVLSTLCKLQEMGVSGDPLTQIARQKIEESDHEILRQALNTLKTGVGPQLTQFDLSERDDSPLIIGDATSPSVDDPLLGQQSPRFDQLPMSAARGSVEVIEDDDLMHGPRSPEAERAIQGAPVAVPAGPREPQAGDVIGGQEWRLISMLGKGGMGSVWKATNHFDETGALKLMLPHLVSNDRLIKRFQLEIRAIKKIRHPNVVELSDWGKDRFHGKEQWYFVTDFIEGRPLNKILQEEGPLDLERAKELFIQLAEGLHAAHAEGVIHRDIKPGNIMVRSDGTPVIIDFGIARQLEDPSMTQTHERVLTLQFASPEQLYGEPVSPKSDVFSLAATLSFVLHPDPKRQRPQFEPENTPEPFHWLLETCLSYKPENRPEDMMAFVDLLKQIEFQNGTIVNFPKRPVSAQRAGLGLTPDQAFTPGASPQPSGLALISLDKELYHYHGPNSQEKLPLSEIVERIKAAPRARHLLWKKGWPNWQMWHKVTSLKEYVQSLKESATQQSSATQAITPFSKHVINVGGCEHTMIALPPGSFWMGNANVDAESDEKPRHRVTLSRGFLLGQTSLTQDLYEVVQSFNPSQYKYPNHPVERVSWLDVVRWCNALSEKQGLKPAYELKELENGKAHVVWNQLSDGYRLPTEAEWEYAARAGSNFTYAGSNRPDEVAWFGASRRREGQKTYRVSQKQANNWDFYDMSGNVWEWCWEDMRGYQATDVNNPVGTVETNYRVCRGGSNYLDARQTRCSYRMRYEVTYRSVFVGFRLARSLH